jgi:acyl carrier protein
MARFGREWPPLGGIAHAAVAPTAAALVDMQPDLLAAMYRTKVQSACLLDSLSASQPVEFFVIFSTTTAILGVAQLGHYAASNAVLDALACSRRAKGRPALSINWGTWDKLLSVSEEDRARIARGGLRPMPTAIGFVALESLLAMGVTRAIVADVDWPVLRAVYETRRAKPLLSRVAAGPHGRVVTRTNEAGASNEPPEIDFASLAPIERRNTIELAVRHEVAKVVGLRSLENVDPALNLFKMGLDSLMAIELKSGLERAMAVALPSALAFNYPSVSALVGFLDATVPDRARAFDDPDEANELLSRLPEMSGMEVDTLLAKMLTTEERKA